MICPRGPAHTCRGPLRPIYVSAWQEARSVNIRVEIQG
jgi:hypothetical protein